MTLAGTRIRLPRAVVVRLARGRAASLGLRAKMVAFTCAVVALVVSTHLIVSASVETTRSRHSTTAMMTELADGFAATVAERLASGNAADLTSVSHALGLSSEVDDVFVFDREGKIIARDVSGMHSVPSVTDPTLMRAIIDQHSLALIADNTVTAAAPVTAADRSVVGYVVLRGSRQDQTASDATVAIAVAAFLLLAGIAAANAFSASLTRRLQALTAAAGRMAAGDLARPVAVDSRDEFGLLAAGLNRAAARTAASLTAYQSRERDLAAHRERAEAASLAKSEFLTRIGNDLRASLNAIVGFSDLLSGPRSRAMGDKTFAAYARDINRSGRHLLTLVTNVVDYVQIEGGATAFKLEVCDAEQLVRAIVEPLERVAEDGGVSLTVESTATWPIVRCDRDRLAKALANLLSIALKGTRAGGTVAVTVAEEGSDNVIVRISDTGGTAVTADIGGRAARGDSGAVLGLALARRIVEQHAGAFRVESYPGIGTVVTIRLPAVSPDTLPPELNPLRIS